MAGRNSATGNNVSGNGRARRRRVVGMGTAVGGFLAAAAMTTGSAPSAEADIVDLLDPIIQPIVTAMTGVIGSVDPAAATDLSSLFDVSGLSLSSIDPAGALSAAAAPASALTSTADAATQTNVDIPLTVVQGTEPTVDVAVNGGPQVPVLVDTGSSGLVIPPQDIGLSHLGTLGFPTGAGIGGYSGGVDYLYLKFDTTVNFDGMASTSATPVDVPILSWPTSFGAPLDFQQFLRNDGVSGILGIGSSAVGPGTSPVQALPGDLSQGVLVDVPQGELVLGPNPLPVDVSTSGAPLSNLLVSVDGGAAAPVSANIDSGGVYGSIPSSLVGGAGTVPPGTTITVDNSAGQMLYSYVTTATNSPAVGGTTMDTGFVPFSLAPVYVDYSPAGTGTTIFDYLPAS